MSKNKSEYEMKSHPQLEDNEKIDLFERVYFSKGNRQVLKLSEPQIEATVSNLLRISDLMELVERYQLGLGKKDGFSEADEIALRQKIFPIIDEELRLLDPTYQIFSAGILELLFAEIAKKE